MQKSSMLFLIIIVVMVAIGLYETLFPLDAPLAFLRFLGLDAFILLCVSLLIGPLVLINHKEFVHLIEPRRSIGLAAFVLTIGHILLAASYDYAWNLPIMLSQLPIILSTTAAIMMTIIAVISSDYALKKLGPKLWKTIQQLNYFVFILSFAHFVLEIKGTVTVSGVLGANFAEIFAILLGIAVVILQIWGYRTRKIREKEAKEKQASVSPATN